MNFPIAPRESKTPDGGHETFDFSSPEDVLVEVIALKTTSPSPPDWESFAIETCAVVRRVNPDVAGAASYESAYGGFLDDVVKDIADCPGAGWFIVEGVTGVYSRGDGWSTDDDMDFSFRSIRPATSDEIALI